VLPHRFTGDAEVNLGCTAARLRLARMMLRSAGSMTARIADDEDE
jgi:hypothetical protein